MEFRQHAYQRQPDAESALGAVGRALGPCEQFERVARQFARHADAVVLNRQQDLAVLNGQLDLTISVQSGVLRRVVDQVPDHLDHTGGIAAHQGRFRTQPDGQTVALGLDQGARLLDDVGGHRLHVECHRRQ